MNHSIPAPAHLAMAQETFARRLVGELDKGTQHLPHSVLERLRVARVRAVAARQLQTVQSVHQVGHSLAMQSPEQSTAWGKWASLLPLLALLMGLIGIHHFQNDLNAHELASIDQALLLDDLPPDAYTDPGFLKFLSLPANQNHDNP